MGISVRFEERSWQPGGIWASKSTNDKIQVSRTYSASELLKWISMTRNIRLEKGMAENREEKLEKELTRHVIGLHIHRLKSVFYFTFIVS